jgi:hypothetical protein
MGFVGELGTLIVVVKSGLTLGFVLSVASFILLLPMLSMLGQVLLGPIRLVDFFKLKSFNTVDVFFKRLIFNKLVWNKYFLKFYLLNRIYFSSIFITILSFGVCSSLFVNYIDAFLTLADFTFITLVS